MSGIFKGDSIYKSGAGGGGYKDGGALVDGDFIKVENNTVSSYDNVSRDPVNFYFEVKNGEVLNSIIELTTSVNATVNVFLYDSITKIYTAISFIDSNVVIANNTYKININGNTFEVEEEEKPTSLNYIELLGRAYRFTKIGNLYFTADNFINDNNEQFVLATEIPTIESKLTGGWRIPKYTDLVYLNSYLGSATAGYKMKSTSGWDGGNNGDNSTGFDGKPLGAMYGGGSPVNVGSEACFWAELENSSRRRLYRLYASYNTLDYITSNNISSGYRFNVRFCKNA